MDKEEREAAQGGALPVTGSPPARSPPIPGDGVTRAGFSASGEINRADFGVCSHEPYLRLAGDKVDLDVKAEAVPRSRQ